jgi:hypothetical protein
MITTKIVPGDHVRVTAQSDYKGQEGTVIEYDSLAPIRPVFVALDDKGLWFGLDELEFIR